MNQDSTLSSVGTAWPALAASLLDFEAHPGRYPLAAREPRLLFDHGTELLSLASGRAVPGLPQDDALQAQLRKAARFFVRTAMLRPGADHYTLMGLTMAFEPGVLREHYRMLMRLTHPDFAGDERAWPQDAATRINQANDVLSSPSRRQDYDRTRGAARLFGSPPAQGVAGQRRPPRPNPPRRSAPVGHPRRRLMAGVLVSGAALAFGAWFLSGSDDTAHLAMGKASPMPEPWHAAAVQPATAPSLSSPPGPAPANEPGATGGDIGGDMGDAAKADSGARKVAPESALVLRPSAEIRAAGHRLQPPPAPIPVPAPPAAGLAIARPVSIAPEAPPSASLATGGATPAGAAPLAAPAPVAPVAAAVAPAAGSAIVAGTPAARLTIEDVQPLLGQLLGALQSGKGDQVVRLIDRSARAGDAADGFLPAYDRVVNRARTVRVGSARFNGRPSADGLSVDGVVLLEVQDDNQQTVTRELVLRAQFAWLGGQPALLRLNAGETSR